jgi:hypothetical protein
MRKTVLALGVAVVAATLGISCLAADPHSIAPATAQVNEVKPQRTPAVKVVAQDRYVFVLQPAKGMPPVLAPTLDMLKSQGAVAVPITIAADRAATAKAVEREISRLLAAGTPGTRITVVAWGTGGDDLIAVAERISSGDVGYVLIDGCADRKIGFRQPLKGRFLSLGLPKPDGSGESCRATFAARGAQSGFSFDEVWVKPSPDGNKAVPQLMIAEAINSWVHDVNDGSDADPR